MRLNLRIRAHPEGHWQQGAWQWDWATLDLSVAPDSPWQITDWSQHPLRITGTVSGLGVWRFTLADPHRSEQGRPHRPAIGSAEARREPDTGQWQVAVDWPGFILQENTHQENPSPALRLLLGRTTLSLNQSQPAGQGARSETNLSVRRVGWITPASQGRFDDLELHTTAVHEADGRRSGFVTLTTRNLRTAQDDDAHAAELRLSLSVQGADAALGMHLDTLLRDVIALARRTPGSPTHPDLWQRVAAQIPRDDLDEPLLSLRHSSAFIDTLSWRTAEGEWQFDGQALGPLAENGHRPHAAWGVIGHLSASGTARAWLATHSALPRTEGDISDWFIEHNASGWHARDIHARTPKAEPDLDPDLDPDLHAPSLNTPANGAAAHASPLPPD